MYSLILFKVFLLGIGSKFNVFGSTKLVTTLQHGYLCWRHMLHVTTMIRSLYLCLVTHTSPMLQQGYLCCWHLYHVTPMILVSLYLCLVTHTSHMLQQGCLCWWHLSCINLCSLVLFVIGLSPWDSAELQLGIQILTHSTFYICMYLEIPDRK